MRDTVAEWDSFRSAYTRHKETHAIAAQAYRDKVAARRAFERTIRSLVRRIQASESTTDRDRQQLGIAVPKRTRARTGPVATRPVLRIDGSAVRRHIVRFRDEATAKSRGKPRGVAECEIWIAVLSASAPAPLPPRDHQERSPFTLMEASRRSPMTATFPAGQAGRTAHYISRWIGFDGSTGKWSAVVSATIAG